MSKEPIIPIEIFEKEIRYRVMSKMLKRSELAGDIETLFREMKMIEPIAILGVRKPISVEEFKQQLDKLVGEDFIKKTGNTIKITKKGIEYAKSPKGESSSLFY